MTLQLLYIVVNALVDLHAHSLVHGHLSSYNVFLSPTEFFQVGVPGTSVTDDALLGWTAPRCSQATRDHDDLEDEVAMTMAVVYGGLRPALRDDCEQWYRDLVDRCVAANPAHRPTATDINDGHSRDTVAALTTKYAGRVPAKDVILRDGYATADYVEDSCLLGQLGIEQACNESGVMFDMTLTTAFEALDGCFLSFYSTCDVAVVPITSASTRSSSLPAVVWSRQDSLCSERVATCVDLAVEYLQLLLNWRRPRGPNKVP
ncbi:hypothetical protein SPRG_11982 [Saprolegnia parasitica CBS 223.65]|uniref:Protein kinase domain-containing protein n=1 Tax=Saprolegnia parasitica (strain CBS 223.65) TaxID=695850 RepID=A0A067C151_SAPPC|nr:hypothetical protein SPRG_11982 [Saprolegnia parasitica CBS 223.65]KDO22845.1 hypothetical protein SPRG_11982 [Saprolegnia parasitica CBS 223.65]|eukprot:XP_012206402.1 hypothetical protein SPRG_11982 [Saprolegnia parasitica CBS 223.65]